MPLLPLLLSLACAPSDADPDRPRPPLDTQDSGGDDSGVDSAGDSGPDDSDPEEDSGAEDSGPTGCRLAVSGALHVEEGDSVSVSVACEDGAAPTGTVTVEGLPALDAGAATFDGTTLTWTPSLADGGRYDLVFGTPQGDFGRATLWVSDAFDAADNVAVDPLAYSEEDGLPVLHLYPAADLNSSYDTPGQLIFGGRTYAVELQTRGASSLYYAQQSYTVEFDADDRFDAAALGLAELDDLVLQTTFDDVAGVRNALGHRVWAALDPSRLAPQTFLVVVYLNGAFHGLYAAIERVDDDFYAFRGLAEEGDLFKSVNHDANFYTTNAYGGLKSTLHDGYEKRAGTPEEGEAGAYDTLDALVSFVVNSDDATFADQLADQIDPDEIIDWFVFVTWGMVTDSGGKNVHLYTDPSLGSPFRVTPWDYNASFGQQWETSKIEVSYTDDFTWTNNLFARMLADPALSDALWGRYRAHLDTGSLREGAVRAEAEVLLEESRWSRARQWRRWRVPYRGYFGRVADVDAEEEYLLTWLDARRDVISAWVDARGVD
jgi:spore coat protein H